jgi:uncharacterized protein YkwD
VIAAAAAVGLGATLAAVPSASGEGSAGGGVASAAASARADGSAGGSLASAAPSARAAGGAVAHVARHATYWHAVLAELNHVRRVHKLPAVHPDRRMSATATSHSRAIARDRSFSHGAWDARVARASGGANALGETLGWMTRSSARGEASSIVHGWLNSAPHRRILLDGRYRRIGIGRAEGRLDGQHAAIYTVDWASTR